MNQANSKDKIVSEIVTLARQTRWTKDLLVALQQVRNVEVLEEKKNKLLQQEKELAIPQATSQDDSQPERKFDKNIIYLTNRGKMAGQAELLVDAVPFRMPSSKTLSSIVGNGQ